MHNHQFKRILVTGATGVAGPAIVDQLLKKGYQVRIFSRHCLDHKGLSNKVERFQGDILDPEAVSMAMENSDAVFHLAAKLHDTKGLAKEDAYLKTNVKGTRRLVNAAIAAGVKRFIFFSTINVYGPSGPNQCFDESSPVCPGEIYSRSKVAAEKIILDAGASTPGFSVVILRVAAVYGKRMKGNYNLLIRYLRRGGFLLLGSGKNQRTLIFDKDLADASLKVLEHPGITGEIYNITDGAVHTFHEIVCSICHPMGRRPLFIKIPEFFIQNRLGLKNKKMNFTPLNRFLNAAEKQMESLAVSGEKIQKEMDFIPEYDLYKGWRCVILNTTK